MRDLLALFTIVAPQRCRDCGLARPLADLEAVAESGTLVGFRCASPPGERAVGLPL